MATKDESREIRLTWSDAGDSVGALLDRPAGARALLTLAHGAGAGMEHPFMTELAARLARVGVATLRYRFPYMEAGRRRPDPPRIATRVVRAAVRAASELADGLPVLAAGKSFGGRMTSTAASEAALEVAGLVFFGFPLHPAGKPSIQRAQHLAHVDRQMLFLQGDRDRLADLDLLHPVVDRLAPRASLHVVEGADHGFHVLKRSGRDDAEVLSELAEETASWIADLGD